MKRVEALQPLSRDHLKALLAAKRLRNATDASAASRDFLEFWDGEGQHHFRVEEEVLLPGCALKSPVERVAVARMLEEHLAIRRGALRAVAAEDQTRRGGTLRRGAMDIRLKRAYGPADPSDGYRVLIDRLWPRGLSRERARLDEWDRELAPSTRLRQWFGHEPSRFEEFRRRYVDELQGHRPALAGLRRRAREGALTLVYAAKDTEHNDAVVLVEVLRRGLPRGAKG